MPNPNKSDFLGELGGVNTLEEGFDPMLRHLEGEEAASPEVEAMAQAGIIEMKEWAASEDGLASIVQVLDGEAAELWKTIPEIAIPMLQKSKILVDGLAEEPTAPSEVFFGDGGLITQAVDILFDVANEIQAPGFEDPDQYAGALMGTYKAVGEHILENDDEVAIEEARSLANDMALTSPSGEQLPPDYYAKKNPVAAGVEQGLLADQEAGVL
jgi:hypothetical protein